jgi:tetratricopeptide (TPR) repeat protein
MEPGNAPKPVTQQPTFLSVLEGPAKGTSILVNEELRIGRQQDGEGQLGGDPGLSRDHAAIHRTPDGDLTIEDHGSTNGTYVNNERITKPQVIHAGDVVRLGSSTLRVGRVPRQAPTLLSPPQAGHPETRPSRQRADSDRSSLARAKQLYEDGDLEGSLAMYRALIASGTDVAAAGKGAGLVSLRMKKYGEADNLLAMSLQTKPSDPDALYLRGQVAAATGQADRAREFYEQALAAEPGHARAASALSALKRQQQRADRDRPSLAQARKLFKDGDLEGSLAMYRALIASGTNLAGAYQGAGYICFLQKNYGEADQLLAKALEQQGPAPNPDALYLRGQIAAATRHSDQARRFYNQALAAEPGHAKASAALSALDRSSVPPGAKPPGPQPQGHPVAVPGTLGVYEYLLQDKSDLSRKAVDLIDKLQISRHPRVTAYLGRRTDRKMKKRYKFLIGLFILFWILVIATHVPVVMAHDGTITPFPLSNAVLISAVVIGIPSFLYLLFAATTRYTIARARVTVASGIFTRNVRTTEIWRFKSVELHQSIPNRLTGDGTLIFRNDDNRSEVFVTGLKDISELTVLRDQFLDLIFTLRSNKIVQGYIA